MIRGNHDIRVGGSDSRQPDERGDQRFPGRFFDHHSAFTGDATADLLWAGRRLAIHDQTFNGATTGRRWKLFRPYVQDDWRVTKNLTVNLGLAWALTTPITEAGNRQANFDFANGKLLIAGAGLESAARFVLSLTAQWASRWIRLLSNRASGWPGSRSEVRTPPFARLRHLPRFSWNQGAQGLWENPPYFAESVTSLASAPLGTPLGAPQNCGLSRSLPSRSLPHRLIPDYFPGTVQSQNLDFKQGRSSNSM